jgi:porin
MDFRPQQMGQAVGVLLFSALTIRAGEPLTVRSAIPADVQPQAAICVACQLAAPLDESPVPARPSRPEDEESEFPPRPDVADDAAPAEEPTEQDETDTEEDVAEELATLLGPSWHKCGSVTGEYFYTGEVFTNTRGGISTQGATRYRGNLDLVLMLDTEQAGWWDRGQFYVYMQQSHGETLTADFVGDAQFYSNIDTSPKPQDLTQLGEYWYQHTIGDDVLSVRVGRQDPNNDFAYADLGSDFINSSFVTLPNIPMPYWPFQTLGVSALYQPHARLRLGGGAYDQGRDVGQWWATTNSRGMFLIAQADFLPLADCDQPPLAVFRAGAWLSTSDTEAVDESRSFSENYGFYTTVDRLLLPEAESVDQGLGAFFQFCWAPSDRNQVDLGIGAGLVYTGLLAGRDGDTCGAGFTRIEFSPDLTELTGQESENAVEVFYKARLHDWLAIVPDLQYIAHPSGLYRDALVAGLRFEMSL